MRSRGVVGGRSRTQIGSVWPDSLSGSITISKKSTKKWERLVGGGGGSLQREALFPEP